jgi:membrane protein implicated in regulation of membrane protease activity
MERQPDNGRAGFEIGVRRFGTEDASLRTLFSRLSSDTTQFIHDEIELGKLELRNVAENLGADLRDAGQALVRDVAKLGVALVLALLAGMTLTVAAALGVSVLVGAYWAGALIVGVILAVAAAVFARSGASDMKDNDAFRFDNTRRAARRGTRVMADEGERTKEFVSDESTEFKQRVTGPAKGGGAN